MVDTVFRLVDNQKTVYAVSQCQSCAEQTDRTITKAFEENRAILSVDFRYDSSAIHCRSTTFAADHRNTVHLAAEDQIQCLHGSDFVIRQCYLIPEPRHVQIARQTWSQRLASNCRWKIGFFTEQSAISEFICI